MTRLLPAQVDTLHQQLLAYRFVNKRLVDRDPGQLIGLVGLFKSAPQTV